jgi:hypothetical protein
MVLEGFGADIVMDAPQRVRKLNVEVIEDLTTDWLAAF